MHMCWAMEHVQIAIFTGVHQAPDSAVCSSRSPIWGWQGTSVCSPHPHSHPSPKDSSISLKSLIASPGLCISSVHIISLVLFSQQEIMSLRVPKLSSIRFLVVTYHTAGSPLSEIWPPLISLATVSPCCLVPHLWAQEILPESWCSCVSIIFTW